MNPTLGNSPSLFVIVVLGGVGIGRIVTVPMAVIMTMTVTVPMAVIMTVAVAVSMMPVIVAMGVAVIVVMMSTRHCVRGDRLAIILTQAQQIAAHGPAELA